MLPGVAAMPTYSPVGAIERATRDGQSLEQLRVRTLPLLVLIEQKAQNTG
jgi:hypothetical protein